jgi:hypothetical protein
MGLVNARISLRNPRKPELAPVEVEALADCGSVHLRIPDHVRIQLELEEIDKEEATLADDSRQLVSYVGPIEVRFRNRVGFVGALVMGKPGATRRDTHGRHGPRDHSGHADAGCESEQSEYCNLRGQVAG